jgi:hypothetical protein
MADAVTILRQEITALEQQLAKRRQALAALTGSATPMKSSGSARPTTRPNQPGGPPLGARIVSYLTANKGKLFVPAQVSAALAKTDKSVQRANVQRRLGELFKRKQVKRENGRYGIG